MTPEKNIIKKARLITNQIDEAYNNLKLRTKIGNLYHDTLYYQNLGAEGELQEMIFCMENKEPVSSDYYESGLQNLKDALRFCRGVIQMQKIELKMGDEIFC